MHLRRWTVTSQQCSQNISFAEVSIGCPISLASGCCVTAVAVLGAGGDALVVISWDSWSSYRIKVGNEDPKMSPTYGIIEDILPWTWFSTAIELQ
jgi:hypothetical protein